MEKKILIFTVRTLSVLTALVGVGIFLLYRDFEAMVPKENPKAFPAFAKKQMEEELEKTLELSKTEVKKAKAMLYKALDNVGEINFPDLIVHDI